jgi:adenylate cyclase
LYVEEGRRATTQSPESISTWGLVVRAINLVSRVGRQANEEAQKLLAKAIKAEPTYAKAHALMGWAVWWAAFNYWLPDEEAGRQEAQQHAEAALLLDPNDPWARMVLGLSQSSAGESEQALRELETALWINPSFALAHAIYGWALARAGRFEAAVDETTKALRLSPSDTYLGLYEFIHGIILLVSRRFDEALPLLRGAVRSFPDLPSSYGLLISCCGHLGLVDEAQSLLVRRNELGPPLTVTLTRQQISRHALGSAITEGLAKAGLPE